MHVHGGIEKSAGRPSVNSSQIQLCITVSAHALFFPPGLHLECCLSPPDNLKWDTIEHCFVSITTRGNGRVKLTPTRTRLFGKRLPGTWSAVRAVPVLVVNAGKSLKAALKSLVKGLGSELGEILPTPS